MTPSRSRGQLVVIVRAGVDVDGGKELLLSPWRETHFVAYLEKEGEICYCYDTGDLCYKRESILSYSA